MAFMLLSYELENYEEWKELFDSDPLGRKTAAKGHRIYRSVENPNQIFLAIEYPSTDDAQRFRERLVESGVLDRFAPQGGPTVVETVEEVAY